MTFRIFGSFRMEELSRLFCKSAIDQNDPFKTVNCLVQSVGMERWLKFECAKNNNISTLIRFDYPSSFLRRIALKSISSSKLHKSGDLTWIIYGKLPLIEKDFLVLKNYICTGSDHKYRRYQLASQLAKVYERYMSYRVDWLVEWERGVYNLTGSEHEVWQGKLWCMIKDEIAGKLTFNFLSMLERSEEMYECLVNIKAKLPSKLMIFGIPSLPPIYIDFFVTLGRIIDIEFYYLSPCEDYWGDVSRFGNNQNILLGRWGGLGKDFYNELLQKDILSFEDIHPTFLGKKE
ncbi:MAG: exodeoxyribonuclease V subunit gamma, partial [Lentisphaeria bacterium]